MATATASKRNRKTSHPTTGHGKVWAAWEQGDSGIFPSHFLVTEPHDINRPIALVAVADVSNDPTVASDPAQRFAAALSAAVRIAARPDDETIARLLPNRHSLLHYASKDLRKCCRADSTERTPDFLYDIMCTALGDNKGTSEEPEFYCPVRHARMSNQHAAMTRGG